jgi:16S rRNA (guanine527-N7)-methyltransferase
MEQQNLGSIGTEAAVSNERHELITGVQELGFSISDEQAAALLQYLEALDITNQSFNLTRIPRHEYVSLHLLDSLTALTAFDSQPGLTIMDIGTGAGFPGVPLAALIPDAHVTLLDSTAKKVRFAADTATTCGIPNCVGIHARAEALGRDSKHRERYDIVVSRAVAAFETLIELMLPLVRVGGKAIALKGAKFEEELAGVEDLVRSLGGAAPRVQTIHLPGSEIDRYLIVVEKTRPTPGKFPRVR